MTIIWAPQSGTSAEGANCMVRAPQARAVGGPTWVWGSVVSSPSGVRGTAPTASDFSYIQIKSELIFGHRCVSIRLQRWANRNKSGTLSQKRDKWAFRETVILFPGHDVKNWNCPGFTLFPPRLTRVSALPRETVNSEIASFHLCPYYN